MTKFSLEILQAALDAARSEAANDFTTLLLSNKYANDMASRNAEISYRCGITEGLTQACELISTFCTNESVKKTLVHT